MTYDGPPIIPGQQQPYTLSSLMPASKPPRPGWVVPLVGFLVVVVVGLAGVTAWALTRSPASAAPAATTTPPPVTVNPVLPLAGPAADACRQIATASPTDVVAMKTIGALASTSPNDSIRISGALLAWSADIASAADGHPDAAEMMADLARSAKDFRDTCILDHYLAA